MSEAGHDLHAEFPADEAVLHELKLGDGHFRDLAAKHHALAREIHQVEAGLSAASDDRLESLKKQRLAVLDEVAAMIARRKQAA